MPAKAGMGGRGVPVKNAGAPKKGPAKKAGGYKGKKKK